MIMLITAFIHFVVDILSSGKWSNKVHHLLLQATLNIHRLLPDDQDRQEETESNQVLYYPMVLRHIDEIKDVTDPTSVVKWNQEELSSDLLCSMTAALCLFFNFFGFLEMIDLILKLQSFTCKIKFLRVFIDSLLSTFKIFFSSF